MKRLARWVVVGLLSVTTVTGCAEDNSPRVPQYPPEGDGWAGISLPHRQAGEPTIFDAIYLCLDRPGSVEIVDVAMEYTNGDFFVEAFATRPALPPDGGSYPEPVTFKEALSDLGYKQGNAVIDTVCAESMETTPKENLTQVGVQFSKPTDKTARGALLRIAYGSAGSTYTYRMGFEAVLCQAEESNPECALWDYDWSQEPVKVRSTTT